MDDADDLVEGVLVDRQLAHPLAGRDLDHLAQGEVGLDGDNFHARDGHLAHHQLAEVDHRREHLALRPVDDLLDLRAGDDLAQLFHRADRGVGVAVGGQPRQAAARRGWPNRGGR